MKKLVFYYLLLCSAAFTSKVFAQSENLKVVFIRHAEKPVKGDNLTCQGLNRAMALPAVLVKKFGVPNFIFVPSLAMGQATKHSRMFQTVLPLVAKYNLTINSGHQENDSTAIAVDIKSKTGVVLVVWEHKAALSIIHELGIKNPALKWPDDDYDSIWIVTFKNGKPVFETDKEGIHPDANCSF